MNRPILLNTGDIGATPPHLARKSHVSEVWLVSSTLGWTCRRMSKFLEWQPDISHVDPRLEYFVERLVTPLGHLLAFFLGRTLVHPHRLNQCLAATLLELVDLETVRNLHYAVASMQRAISLFYSFSVLACLLFLG